MLSFRCKANVFEPTSMPQPCTKFPASLVIVKRRSLFVHPPHYTITFVPCYLLLPLRIIVLNDI
jgi:hypothetical protein